MLPVRIMLIGLPRLLSDVVHALAATDDGLEVVAELARVDLPPPELETGLDTVVTTRGMTQATIRSILEQWPRARIVALSRDGGESSVFTLALYEAVLGPISLGRLRAELGRRSKLDQRNHSRLPR